MYRRMTFLVLPLLPVLIAGCGKGKY